jgi:hypothetical protein
MIDEKGDMLADYHNTSNTWKNYFCQVLNVHGVSDVRQTEIHTAEPLVPEPNSCDVEVATEKLKRCKSPCTDSTPEMTEAVRCVPNSTNLLILFGIRHNYRSSERDPLLYLFIRRK